MFYRECFILCELSNLLDALNFRVRVLELHGIIVCVCECCWGWGCNLHTIGNFLDVLIVCF